MENQNNAPAQNEAVEHIGGEPHKLRNLLVVVGLLVGAALIGLFYWREAKSGDVAVAELQQFRQVMASQCQQAQFEKPATVELNKLYAESSRLQAVVMEQGGVLKRGQANCDQVMRALKSVDYPLEP